MANERNGHGPDRWTRRIFEELRDLSRQAAEDRRQAAADRRQAAEDRRRSDERFETAMRQFREDSIRRHAEMRSALKDIGRVGVAIVRAIDRNTRVLQYNTRILERIDRNTGGRRNGPPPPRNGPRA